MSNRLEKLFQLLEKDKSDPFIYYGIALEYKASSNITMAIEYFELLLSIFPDYLPAYMQYGLLQQSSNKIEHAKKLFIDGISKAKEQNDHHTQKELEEFLNDLE
jgi:tetratricopeptide (TPR) repeat protein